ncbi:MAG: SGNH/GDSL hydrolase family protein [Candidatus Omnitrophica bacterium]|nr:SGNH/GDSL hydrolase family protein [Candidatus Omnitrophota bacterium]
MDKLKFTIFVCFVCTVVLFYAISEFVLTRLGLPREYQRHSSPLQFASVADPEVGYGNIPNASIDFVYDGNPRGYFSAGNMVSHHTNNLGFRGPQVALSKPTNTTRVMFLGDSFTFGEGVRDEDTYAEQFRRLANAPNGRLAQIPGYKPVESVNLGVGGFNTSQEWALLNDAGNSLSPDYIVIGYTLNDAEGRLFTIEDGRFVRADREARVAEGLATRVEAPAWIKIFRLHKLLWQAYNQFQLSKKTIQHYEDIYRTNELDWQKTKSAFSSIGTWSREHKVPVIVVIFPVLYKINNHYPFESIHNLVHAELDKAGLSYIDLWPALKRYRDMDLWVHPTDQHPNEKVHRIAAEELEKYFLALVRTTPW